MPPCMLSRRRASVRGGFFELRFQQLVLIRLPLFNLKWERGKGARSVRRSAGEMLITLVE